MDIGIENTLLRAAQLQLNFGLRPLSLPSRCFVDCGSIVSASNKFRVTSECPNSACNGSVYEWHLEKLQEDTTTWINVAILPNMTSTGVMEDLNSE